MTQLYYASISEEIHNSLMQKYANEFSFAFSKKLIRYRRWQDAQLSMLGRLLLKHGFECNYEIFSDKDLVFSEYNKPMLKEHPFQFNISHSGDIAICIISDVAEVGIDIEQMKEIKIEDFKFQMVENEWNKLIASDSTTHAFFDYWTQKEAVLKANGKGLSIPLNSFVVNESTCNIGEDDFYLKNIHVKSGYKCHLAFKNIVDEVKIVPEEVVFNL